MTGLLEITFTESICGCITLGLQALFLSYRRLPVAQICLVVLSTTPITLFSAASMTRFLSWDESYIFYDIINYYGHRLSQWEYGAFRTTTLTLGPLLALVQTVTGMTKDVVLIMAKSAHWLTGAALSILLTDQLYPLFPVQVPRYLFHLFMFNVLLLLPVTELALKTLNYDLLSMLLGIIGCLWCVKGLQPIRKKTLFAGLTALTLAAQEKLIASPLLWAGLVLAITGMTLRISPCSWRTLVRTNIFQTITADMFSLTIVIASFILVYLSHGPEAPAFTMQQLLHPFISGLWPIVHQVSFLDATHPLSPPQFSREVAKTIVGIGIIVLMTSTASLLLCVTHRLIYKPRTWNPEYPSTGNDNSHRIHLIHRCRQVLDNTDRLIPLVNITLLVCITITGIIASYAIKVKIWPLFPIPADKYSPSIIFNGITHHYGCSTFFTHTLASTAWACSVIINALPTAFLAAMIVAGIFRCRLSEKLLHSSTSRPRDILALFFMLALLSYGVFQIPLFPRYLNLFLLGTVITTLPDIFTIQLRHPAIITSAMVAGLLCTFGEILPFQPNAASFRPIWSNTSRHCNNNPCFGMVTPWYPGWGEELLIAADRIRQREPGHTGLLTLYYNFPAALICPPENIRTSAMPEGLGLYPFRYTDHDFYVLSRNGVSTYPSLHFPDAVKPLFTIAERNFVKAWIFRGIDLDAAGFHFISADDKSAIRSND